MYHTPHHSFRAFLAVAICICATPAFATHLIGDEFTYRYLGGTKYEVTLNLYADCLAGQPLAISEDNPAIFGIYKGSTLFLMDNNVPYSSSGTLPATLTSPCGTSGVPLCILKRTFTRVYNLPPSTSAYTIVYQRCCKNIALTNIVAPGNIGSTYYCVIPPSGIAATNSSAVFTNYPPAEIALTSPFTFDNSATDADGDSLSYELCSSYSGASDGDIKPNPAPPPFRCHSLYCTTLLFQPYAL